MCCLLSGCRYAVKVVAPAGKILPLQHGVYLKDAITFPEMACSLLVVSLLGKHFW